MDPVSIMNLALLSLKAVLNVIAEIRGTSGISDDAILAQAQTLTGDNDALYTTLTAHLKSLPPSA